MRTPPIGLADLSCSRSVVDDWYQRKNRMLRQSWCASGCLTPVAVFNSRLPADVHAGM